MCTLIVLHRCVAGRPLVVAANRDEFLDRPAEDFAIRSSRTGPILSPLDLEAGGTWVGLSQRGVFAGLTNLRPLSAQAQRSSAANTESSGAPASVAPVSKLKSRGEVVMAALEAESAADAVRMLSKLEEGIYNPFQLLVADGRDAYLIVYRDRARIVELEPGPHIVGNVENEQVAAQLGVAGLFEKEDERERAELRSGNKTEYPGFEGISVVSDVQEPRALKLTRIRERVEKMVAESDRDSRSDLFEGLARVCREHVDSDGSRSPFEATCVHITTTPTTPNMPTTNMPSAGGQDVSSVPAAGGPIRYGTRSSLLLELSEDPGSSRLWAADGAPCEHPFENRSSLLKDLGVRLGG